MRASRSAVRIAVGSAMAGTLALVQSASGQNASEPQGLRLVVDYTAGIDIDTNDRLRDPSPGTYLALVNGFDFALLSDTRTESLALTFGTELRLEDDPEDGTEDEESDGAYSWQSPAFRLEYSREAANARLAASANLRVRDIDTIEPFFIDLDGDTIIDEAGFEEAEGTLTETGASIILETRRNAPISTTYALSYQARSFDDTDDPDLYDRTEYRFRTTTRLRFSEVSTGSANLTLRQYEYTGGRDLIGESISARVGLNRELSPTLTTDFSIGYTKDREEETIDGVTFIDTEQGPNFSARLSKTVPDGSYFGTYSRDLVQDTFRNTLRFGREISMQNYDLSASVGVTALDGGELGPDLGLIYTRALPDGRFTASFRRTLTLDTEDEERSLTSAVVGYSQQINELSSFSLGLDYAFVASPGGEDASTDQTRTTFRASYSRALTRDWNMTVGYSARSKTDEDEDAFSNAVFMNLGRRFILRP